MGFSIFTSTVMMQVLITKSPAFCHWPPALCRADVVGGWKQTWFLRPLLNVWPEVDYVH